MCIYHAPLYVSYNGILLLIKIINKWAEVNYLKSNLKSVTRLKLNLSQPQQPTCVWYWRSTCGADAIGPGHDGSLSGSFSKETYSEKERETWNMFHCENRTTVHQIRHTNQTNTRPPSHRLNIKQHDKQRDMNWLHTHYGRSHCRWKHRLSAVPSPDNRGWKKEKIEAERLK